MLEEDMNEENEEFSKLKGITVTLTPYRDSELCQNNDDQQTNMSSKPNYQPFLRPFLNIFLSVSCFIQSQDRQRTKTC